MFKKIGLVVFRFINNTILETILFAFVLFYMFTHLQYIINNLDEQTIQCFWEALRMDISQSPYIYIPFIVVFLWWAIVKYISIKNANRERKEHDELITSVKGLLEKISNQLENRNGK